MVEVSEYNLPDIELLNEESNKFLLWIPDKTYIVLGASNKAHIAVAESLAIKDNITVMKRRTGGQTVMLTPNNLIISAVITDESIMKPKDVIDDAIEGLQQGASYTMAEDVVYRLLKEDIVTEREAELILAAVDRSTLQIPLPDRDALRTRLLQAMLATLRYEG